jgi:hypothetical protein
VRRAHLESADSQPSPGLINALKVSVGVHGRHQEISDSWMEKSMRDNFQNIRLSPDIQTWEGYGGRRTIPLATVRSDTGIVSLVGRLFTKITQSHQRHWVVIERYYCRLHCSSIFSPTTLELSHSKILTPSPQHLAPLKTSSSIKSLHCTKQLHGCQVPCNTLSGSQSEGNRISNHLLSCVLPPFWLELEGHIKAYGGEVYASTIGASEH